MLYPLTFQPIFKERIWGGRSLEHLFQKKLPPQIPIGESWEISDRPGDASVIAHGPLAGRNLRWLMEHHQRDLLGDAEPAGDRFPLLIKLLDAREKLSLQVHPPAHLAAELGGDPKTEMWYIAQAEPGAELYIGLKRGMTRPEFERKVRDGTVADCFHRLPVKPGDAVFLPSGRVHALGAGIVLFEIQQNSDTTYRVFDWNRVGLDGKPRELHVAQSLASIDFGDFEPGLAGGIPEGGLSLKRRSLAANPLFVVKEFHADRGAEMPVLPGRLQIIGVVSGVLEVADETHQIAVRSGEFCLLPACLGRVTCRAQSASVFLHVQAGE